MEKDKSIVLQKQVRDNADDLKKEFLDMKNWEEQMKKADNELRYSNDTDNQILPPVRKKKISSRTKSKTKENGSKPKRIKSYDYSAWDHYDVDKACEEVEKENESEDSGDEILSQEELEKKHEEATKHKVMGNVYVQEQKWDKAMACYNEAIKIFPHDAVFYANRALCHLKMDNLYSAEADCTAAIQRDEFYVKAYHRRATARMALKQYKEAVQDLKHLLTIESTNKEAKRMLSIATKYSEGSKPVIINSDKTIEDEILIENAKDEKSPSVLKVEPSKEIQKENKKEEVPNATVNDAIVLPDWLPITENNVKIINPIEKPPHQRSKMPLKKIPITKCDFIDLSTEISPNISITSTEKSYKKVSNNISAGMRQERDSKEFSNENKNKENENKDENIEIPSIPKTSIEFLLTWRKYEISKFRYKYLKQLPAELIPKLFQHSMESSTFAEILSILVTQFISHKDSVFNYLKYLSQVKRFSTLTMFMGKKEKEDLNVLFNYCHTNEGQPDDAIKEMRIKYEI